MRFRMEVRQASPNSMATSHQKSLLSVVACVRCVTTASIINFATASKAKGERAAMARRINPQVTTAGLESQIIFKTGGIFFRDWRRVPQARWNFWPVGSATVGIFKLPPEFGSAMG